MNLWECLIDAFVECELGTPSSSSNVTLQDAVRWANKGQDIIADKSLCIEKLMTFSSVAEQMDYVPDSSFIRPIKVDYTRDSSNNYDLTAKDIIKFREYENQNYRVGWPEIYSVFDKKIKIYPPVSTSAGTASYNTTFSASATTITGITSTANLPKRSRGIIDSEVISWTGKTDTTLTGLTRGLEGTTAVAHDGNVSPKTITERDISLWCNARYKTRTMKVYNTGTCLFTLSDATVTGTSTNFLANVFPGDYIGTGTNPSKFYQVLSVTSDVALELTTTFGETTTTSTSYVASSPIDIPDESSDLLTLYMIYRIKKKLELEPSATQYENEFNEKVQQLYVNMVYNNKGAYPNEEDVPVWSS